MARVIGSSFRRPFMVQPRQESSLERNLAQFASPQGMYLLAKGLGSLGGVSLPWGGSEGGVDKTQLAAAARAKAMQTVQDSTQANREAKRAAQASKVGPVSGATTQLAQSQEEEWRQGDPGPDMVQTIDPETNRMVLREVGRQSEEKDRLSPESLEMVRATQEGRPVNKELEVSRIGEGLPGGLLTGDLSVLSDEELLAAASGIQGRNRQFAKRAQGFMEESIIQGQDPEQAMLAIGQTRDGIKQYNARVVQELQSRTAEGEAEGARIQEAPEGEFTAGLDPIYRMSPDKQRSEIRRLAKNVKTDADRDKVREYMRNHTPEVATFGDLFTSESDRRKEFETEVEELIPVVDPLLELKRLKLQTGIEGSRATTAAHLAEINRNEKKDRLAEAKDQRAAEEHALKLILNTAKDAREESRLRLERRRVRLLVAKAAKKKDPKNFASDVQKLINKHGYALGGVKLRKLQGLYNRLAEQRDGVITAEGVRLLEAEGLADAIELSGTSLQAQARARELGAGQRSRIIVGEGEQAAENVKEP